ncbi:unnamed protein product, partial [Iphiclides podalirius]
MAQQVERKGLRARRERDGTIPSSEAVSLGARRARRRGRRNATWITSSPWYGISVTKPAVLQCKTVLAVALDGAARSSVPLCAEAPVPWPLLPPSDASPPSPQLGAGPDRDTE